MSEIAAGKRRTLQWRTIWLFAAASLISIGLGAIVMAQADIPLGIWVRNPAAWIIAAALFLFLASRGWLGPFLAPIALVIVALSLIGPDQQGVHRWLGLGPILLNAAALILPAAIAAFGRDNIWLTTACFALMAAILAWQPDISQLAALSAAAVILLTSRFGWRGALASLILVSLAMAFCLTRPDPLAPVPHVEGIFLLAWDQSPMLSVAMAIALAAAALSPLLLWPIATLRWKAAALSAYLAISALACLFGAYPVPLAGYGLSFVIGWWLGIAALAVPQKRAG